MAVHRLAPGRAVLDGLERLSLALGYSVTREFIVRSTAAVDLACFAANDERIPLMIFEVESSASSSMANNAMKVLSRGLEDFVKPLFFFHVLLSGGPDNERIADLRRTWGNHNYDVYRLNESSETERLIRDLLGQHRRTTSGIDLVGFFNALRHVAWADVDVRSIFNTVVGLGFDTNYTRELATLCLQPTPLREVLINRFCDKYVAGAVTLGHYTEYVGQFAGLLEIPLLVAEGTLADAVAPTVLDRWQLRTGRMRSIGPYFGLDRDYDTFLLCLAPTLFAVAATIARGSANTMAWLAQQLAELVSGELHRGVTDVCITSAQTWLLHLNAAALRDVSNADLIERERELLDVDLQVRLALESRGLRFGQLIRPLGPADLLAIGDGDEDREVVGDWRAAGPIEWWTIQDGYFPQFGHQSWTVVASPIPVDKYGLALTPSLDESWLAWPSNALIPLLHRAP